VHKNYENLFIFVNVAAKNQWHILFGVVNLWHIELLIVLLVDVVM